ncbi:Ff.00g080050.m01.CDS01 [Fusarium sp. VM40]|nr:Ff.00g080050.m01.CDS01 [Fusarium sp. VM40]
MEPKKTDHYPQIVLPVEIVLLIIEHLIPHSAGPRPILPAISPITKTLLAFTTVSRATHFTASRMLWQNCLYIDSRERLRALRKSVSQKSFITGCTSWEAYAPTRIFLGPSYLPEEITESENSPVADEASSIHRLDLTPDGELVPLGFETTADDNEETFRNRPDGPDDQLVPGIPMYSDLQNLSIVEDVRMVLFTLAPVLKILVVDMPLRNLYREDDHCEIRKILREGFEALVDIEELVSVRDELYLDSTGGFEDPQVWIQWPKLKRMALYNVSADEELWQNMLLCPQLETAIFTRADDVEYDEHLINVKREWSRAWVAGTSGVPTTNKGQGRYSGPEITIAFCNTAPELPKFGSYIHSWHTMDPENKICVLTVPTDTIYFGQSPKDYPWHNDPIGVSQEWIRNRALTGTLWEDIKRESFFISSKSGQDI